jgi:hypothetical protein
MTLLLLAPLHRRRHSALRLGIVLLFLADGVAARAQSSAGAALEGPPPPTFPAVVARDGQGRVTLRTSSLPSPLTFDGRLNEPFYRDVPSFGDFIQQEPREGQGASEKTEVWVFYDRDNLYVSARLWESEAGHRVATEMRRDANSVYTDDHFGVSFDGFYDRRNGYGFAVNSLGGLLDWSINNEQPNNSWNGVWDVRTGEFEHGWTLEIRFPFRSFRFAEGGSVWGLNLRRMVRWKNELSYLVPVLSSWGRPAMSRMSVAATLTGLEVPGKGRNVDVKPYALGSVLTDRKAATPYTDRPDGNLGLDVKWGIRQTLIADLTVNTDFAQVEDDEQQVNLTRFSIQFPEKRDFFLEGADTFNFGSGSSGTGGTGGGGGVQGSGQNSSTAPLVFYSRRVGLNNGLKIPIEVGGRLIGRAGPWRVGALNIQTAESTDARTPSSNFSVIRASRDVLRRSRVGAIVTRRAPMASAALGAAGPDNLGYGVDANINPSSEVSILGYLAKTRSSGKSGNDQSYRGRLDWNNDRYGVQVEHLAVEPNFNPEVGFLRRASFRRSFGQARFSPRPRWRGVRKVIYIASVDYITDMKNRPESKEIQGTYEMNLDNSDTWSVEATKNYERLNNAFEVGKNVFVPVGEYAFKQVRGTYSMGTQRPLSGSISAARGSFYDGTLSEVTWRGRVEVSKQLYAEPVLSWNRVETPAGTADSNLVSARGTYSISPRMFVSALAQYATRTDTIALNARFRWEYLPGSELFVVYSDGRTTLNSGFPSVENRSFVVKATRLMRW